VEELAAQIASARGPSGPNAEYLYRLVDALVQVRSHGHGALLRSHQIGQGPKQCLPSANASGFVPDDTQCTVMHLPVLEA